MRKLFGRTLPLLALAGAVFASCATNPVTGRRELALVSESQEIAMGRQYSQEVLQSMGEVDDPALQSYVSNLGKSLAAISERPQLPWEFHVVEDASVNAFALPGGFIFVTRGLLTHLMNEAELAAVLGHENGHVTARHSVQQISRQQLAQIGLGVGMILSPEIAQFGDLASAGLGVLFLKFGRDDELQADQLGFRYSLHEGYDVREMVSVFEMLQRQGQLAGGGKLPEWQSTHPDPGNRIQQTRNMLAGVTEDLSDNKVGEEVFLQRINGLVFGENPRNGFFEGTMFLHPDLRFQLEFPTGWKTQNQPSAVVGVSSSDDAIMEFRFAEGSAAQAADAFFRTQGIQAGTVSRTTIHGFPAVSGEFSATVEQGTLRGVATFLEDGGKTYRILSYTPSSRYATYSAVMQRAHGSYQRLTNQAALTIQPLRVRVETVPRAMTLQQFQQQFPSEIPIERLAIINGVQVDAQLRVGMRVKRVVR